MQFTINVGGEQVIDRTLLRFVERLESAQPAFERIGDQFAQAEMANFLTQGGGWAPLSPGYAAYKAARFPGRPILVRTGEMRDSLTHRPFGIDTVGDTRAEFGTADPKAKYHQHGTSKMPARPPVKVSEGNRNEMAKTLQRYLMTGSI
ncbi:hypothetical protein D1871_11095 [Nakamurella silvestris]|nr:hypothetical protein D1871_11095 [Nakamurella silvestris]